MLDLGSLTVAMGIQSEMPKIRQDSGCENVYHGVVESPPVVETETVLSTVAESVEGALHVVENAATCVVEALMPAPTMVTDVLESCTVSAPEFNLSLPKAAAAKK